MAEAAFEIRPARSREDLSAVAQLFEAYVSSLDVDLSFQDFAAELAGLPGKYAPPAGELLLARGLDGVPLGCVGLRPLPAAGCCEMKRLYVSPQARGLGLGRALAEEITAQARRIGYGEIRLDTLPSMASAIALYRELGFTSAEPYYETPIPGTMFLARSLTG